MIQKRSVCVCVWMDSIFDFFVLLNVLFGRQFIHSIYSIHSIRIESFETKLMANKTLFLTINRPSPATNWGFEFIETEHKRLGSILVVQNVS